MAAEVAHRQLLADQFEKRLPYCTLAQQEVVRQAAESVRSDVMDVAIGALQLDNMYASIIGDGSTPAASSAAASNPTHGHQFYLSIPRHPRIRDPAFARRNAM